MIASQPEQNTHRTDGGQLRVVIDLACESEETS